MKKFESIGNCIAAIELLCFRNCEIPYNEIKFGESYGTVQSGIYKNKIVAIKQFIIGENNNGLEPADILWELNSLQILTHPRIIKYIGTCLHPKNPNILYLITEFADNRSLYHYQRSTEYTITDALEIALQVAAGIEFLHSQNYVHGHIRPSNILMTSEGAKIAHFAHGRPCFPHSFNSHHHPSESEKHLIESQMNNKKIEIQDKQADIFAFGVILWHLYHPQEELKELVGQNLPQITNCPELVRELILKCCASNPYERYTAEEIVSIMRSNCDL